MYDMGLGKTLTTLSALEKSPGLVTLLVGPIRVIESVWPAEIAKWGINLTYSLVRGSAKQRRKALDQTADLYLINPEGLKWLCDQGDIKQKKFSCLVVDESSAFREPNTRRFRAFRHQVKYFRYRYILTASPRPNRELDLWAQMFLVDQGEALGASFSRFKDQFFSYNPYTYTWSPKEGAEKRIRQMIAPYLLNVNRADADIDLPPIQYNRIEVILPNEAMVQYLEVEDSAILEIDQEQAAMTHAFSKLNTCRQLANGIVYFGEDRCAQVTHREKVNLCRQIVEETNRPIIIAYHFQHELEVLKAEFKGYRFTDLHDRGAIEKWNNRKLDLFFLHPKSGGHGLNLQEGGADLLFFSLSYSFDSISQTVGRIYRPGQTEPVLVHYLIARGTVDEVLAQALQEKRRGQNSFLNEVRKLNENRTRHNPSQDFPWL